MGLVGALKGWDAVPQSALGVSGQTECLRGYDTQVWGPRAGVTAAPLPPAHRTLLPSHCSEDYLPPRGILTQAVVLAMWK